MTPIARLLPVLAILSTTACAAVVEEDSAPGSGAADPDGALNCDVPSEDKEAACFEDDIAACCIVIAIPHEFEWHEANKKGDVEEAKRRWDAMYEAVDHACSIDFERACEWLDTLQSSSE